MFYMIRSVVDTCLFAHVKSTYSIKAHIMRVYALKGSGKSYQLSRKCQGKCREIYLIDFVDTLYNYGIRIYDK